MYIHTYIHVIYLNMSVRVMYCARVLGSLSRFGRLRLQKQNDFHFNISMKSHIMNVSQNSKCYFLFSLENSSKNSWLMSCG